MSTQIAVRLPDELVAFLDEMIDRGEGASRAAIVTRALKRERRRQLAERDAAILIQLGPDPDMTALAEWGAHRRIDLD